MAVVAVTTITSDRDGQDLGAEYAVANAGTDSFSVPNSGNTLLLFHATTANARTATVAASVAVDGTLTVAGRTVAVGASKYNLAGPFPIGVYGSTLTVTASHIDLTIAAALEKGN